MLPRKLDQAIQIQWYYIVTKITFSYNITTFFIRTSTAEQLKASNTFSPSKSPEEPKRPYPKLGMVNVIRLWKSIDQALVIPGHLFCQAADSRRLIKFKGTIHAMVGVQEDSTTVLKCAATVKWQIWESYTSTLLPEISRSSAFIRGV